MPSFSELQENRKKAAELNLFWRMVSGLIALVVLVFAYGLIFFAPLLRYWPTWLFPKKKPE